MYTKLRKIKKAKDNTLVGKDNGDNGEADPGADNGEDLEEAWEAMVAMAVMVAECLGADNNGEDNSEDIPNNGQDQDLRMYKKLRLNMHKDNSTELVLTEAMVDMEDSEVAMEAMELIP